MTFCRLSLCMFDAEIDFLKFEEFTDQRLIEILGLSLHIEMMKRITMSYPSVDLSHIRRYLLKTYNLLEFIT